ncbi:MAG: response regulator [Oligoflexales bacterium]|nr:response regulator [Oligoflexales bacterium]
MGKILFVEDSEDLREDFKSSILALEGDKYEVLLAENGQQGLDILKDEKIDILLTDIHMPVMNGMTMIENIRSDSRMKDLPIFVLTTETNPEMREKGLALGIKSWIYKPYNVKAMLKIFARYKAVG